MAEPRNGLTGRRLLVVEDDYLIALEVAHALESRGATIAGLAGTVEDALELVRADTPIDAAVLDVNLGGEWVFPVADALAARGVPFVFATGYDAKVLPGAYSNAPHCQKPITGEALARALADQFRN